MYKDILSFCVAFIHMVLDPDTGFSALQAVLQEQRHPSFQQISKKWQVTKLSGGCGHYDRTKRSQVMLERQSMLQKDEMLNKMLDFNMGHGILPVFIMHFLTQTLF